MKPTIWVLRDLSNGNGADQGIMFPTYIWVHPTRETARNQARRHRARPRTFSNLSAPECWARQIIERLYGHVSTRPPGNYYRRVNP